LERFKFVNLDENECNLAFFLKTTLKRTVKYIILFETAEFETADAGNNRQRRFFDLAERSAVFIVNDLKD
jgi:hypothetical protein